MKFLIKTIVGILVATQAYAAPKKQVPINVASDFKKAYGFYSKGQMKNAVTILTKIVKRYPKHTPSRALLADILAQQGLYANAARLYAKVGINNLPRQSYFNYGLSMYSTKNCSLALKAFSRVPPNAPHYYDSLFYSGVCQMRARRWDKAERLFQLATNVSPELRSSQRQLLIESRKRARGEERGNADDLSSYTLQAPQPLIYMPVYQYQYPVGPPTPGIQIIPKRKAVVEGPKSGFVLEGSPRAKTQYESELAEKHGFKSNEVNRVQYGGGLGLNAKYNFRPSSNGQGYFSLVGDVDYLLKQSSSIGIKNTTDTDSPDQISAQQTVNPVLETQTLTVTGRPKIEFPISENWSLNGSGEVRRYYLDVAAVTTAVTASSNQVTNAIGEYYAQGGLSMSIKNVVAALNYFYRMRVTWEETPSFASHRADVSLRKTFDSFDIGLDAYGEMFGNLIPKGEILPQDPDKPPTPPVASTGVLASPEIIINAALTSNFNLNSFKLGANIAYKMIMMQEGISLKSIDYGAESRTTIEGVLSVPFGSNFNFNLNVACILHSGYTVPDAIGTPPTDVIEKDPKANDILADGVAYEFTPGIVWKPFDFISLASSFKYRTINWTAQKKENQDKFEQEVTNVLQLFTVSATVTKTF